NFRGLLRLHTYCGSHDRSAAQATFVTRLRSSQSPGQTARQLPDPKTPIRVESSSTRETRLQGAHRNNRRGMQAGIMIEHLNKIMSAKEIADFIGIVSTFGERSGGERCRENDIMNNMNVKEIGHRLITAKTGLVLIKTKSGSSRVVVTGA